MKNKSISPNIKREMIVLIDEAITEVMDLKRWELARWFPNQWKLGAYDRASERMDDVRNEIAGL